MFAYSLKRSSEQFDILRKKEMFIIKLVILLQCKETKLQTINIDLIKKKKRKQKVY